jgi:hypothetical protein
MSRAGSFQSSVVSFQFQLQDEAPFCESRRAAADFSAVGDFAWFFVLITEN